MATFITLVNFTDQGIKGVKESPDRFVAFRTMAEKMGVFVKSAYWTVGNYDIVVTVENDEAVTAALLKIGSLGNIGPRRCAPSPPTNSRRSSPACRDAGERPGGYPALIGSACSASRPERPAISPSTTQQRGSAAVGIDSASARSGISR